MYEKGKKGSGILSQSAYYIMPSRDVKVSAVIEATHARHVFKSFIKALFNNNVFNLTSSAVSHTAFLLFAYFLLVISIHDSRFVDYCYHKRVWLHIPACLEPILLKVSTRVNSLNRVSATTRGELVILNLDKLLAMFRDFSREEWRDLFFDTPLSKALDNTKNFDRFQRLVSLLIPEDTTDLDTFYSHIVRVSSELIQAYYYADRYSQFDGFLHYNETATLGIYRFRNDHYHDLYIFQQNTVTSMNVATLEFFACFLKLFNPSFIDNNGKPLPYSLLSGEAVIDVSALSLTDAWEKYLSFESKNGSPGDNKKRRGDKYPGKQNTTASNSLLELSKNKPDDNTNSDALSSHLLDLVSIEHILPSGARKIFVSNKIRSSIVYYTIEEPLLRYGAA